jgi:hypothetical protein
VPVTYFNGEKDEKIMMDANMYVSTAAEFGGWTDIICDFLMGEEAVKEKKKKKKKCKKSGKCSKKKKSKKYGKRRRMMDFSYLLECDLTGAADPLLGETIDAKLMGEKAECKNDDSIGDIDGFTCTGWYDERPYDCGEYDSDKFISEKMCCACKPPAETDGLGITLVQPDLEIFVIEAVLGAYFGFDGEIEDVKNCFFGDEDCDPLQVMVDSSFALTAQGTVGIDLDKIASYLPKLNVKLEAKILKTNIGLYTGLKISLLDALNDLCNNAFKKMTIPLTCPDFSIALNTWITNKDIGFTFSVYSFEIGCKFIYANGHISCHVGYGRFKFYLTVAVSTTSLGRRNLRHKRGMQMIADAVHDPQKLVIVEDCCEDCLTGVVIHAGDKTPDHEGEPIVNGEWTTVEKVDKVCHEMGEEGTEIIEHIESVMMDKMKKEENKNPGDPETRRRLHTTL